MLVERKRIGWFSASLDFYGTLYQRQKHLKKGEVEEVPSRCYKCRKDALPAVLKYFIKSDLWKYWLKPLSVVGIINEADMAHFFPLVGD